MQTIGRAFRLMVSDKIPIALIDGNAAVVRIGPGHERVPSLPLTYAATAFLAAFLKCFRARFVFG